MKWHIFVFLKTYFCFDYICKRNFTENIFQMIKNIFLTLKYICKNLSNKFSVKENIFSACENMFFL